MIVVRHPTVPRAPTPAFEAVIDADDLRTALGVMREVLSVAAPVVRLDGDEDVIILSSATKRLFASIVIDSSEAHGQAVWCTRTKEGARWPRGDQLRLSVADGCARGELSSGARFETSLPRFHPVQANLDLGPTLAVARRVARVPAESLLALLGAATPSKEDDVDLGEYGMAISGSAGVRLVRRALVGMPSASLQAHAHRALSAATRHVEHETLDVAITDRHLVVCGERLTVGAAVEFRRTRRFRDLGTPTLLMPSDVLRRAFGWAAAEAGFRPIAAPEFVGIVHDVDGLRLELSRSSVGGRYPLLSTPRRGEAIVYEVSPSAVHRQLDWDVKDVAVWCSEFLAIGLPDQSDVLVIGACGSRGGVRDGADV